MFALIHPNDTEIIKKHFFLQCMYVLFTVHVHVHTSLHMFIYSFIMYLYTYIQRRVHLLFHIYLIHKFSPKLCVIWQRLQLTNVSSENFKTSRDLLMLCYKFLFQKITLLNLFITYIYFLTILHHILYAPLPYITYLIDSCQFLNLPHFSCERDIK